MKERPILMSGPMVRATLAGDKTNTRRVVTVPWAKGRRAVPYDPYYIESDGQLLVMDEYGDPHPFPLDACPYGGPGDRLWVRESFQRFLRLRDPEALPGGLVYAADLDACGQCPLYDDTEREPGTVRVRHASGLLRTPKGRWHPSIHMPRVASRLLLDVTEVRIERLQAITDDDIRAEGIQHHPVALEHMQGIWTWRGAFAAGWDAINGRRKGCRWSDNPWVWVVAFRRVAP